MQPSACDNDAASTYRVPTLGVRIGLSDYLGRIKIRHVADKKRDGWVFVVFSGRFRIITLFKGVHLMRTSH